MNDEASSQSLRKAMEQEFDDMDFEIPEAQNRLSMVAKHIQVCMENK